VTLPCDHSSKQQGKQRFLLQNCLWSLCDQNAVEQGIRMLNALFKLFTLGRLKLLSEG
jgi:hypothetical protein